MKAEIKNAEAKMQKSIEKLEKAFSSVRAGRANPQILDKVSVDYYGAMTPINQMAAISVAEARVLVIQPWDKTTLSSIEKAIIKADIGIMPNNDGTIIRLVFPPLTEERRKDLCKEVHKYGEECKVSIRGIRRDTNDKLKAMKKDSAITEDEQKEGEKETQNLTDKYCKTVDTLIKDKETEIMEI